MPTRPVSLTSRPVSSRTSRVAASATNSPSSTPPPGKHQTSRSARLVRSTPPSETTTAAVPQPLIGCLSPFRCASVRRRELAQRLAPADNRHVPPRHPHRVACPYPPPCESSVP